MLKRNSHEKAADSYSVGVEKGLDGSSAAWCLELPGCYAYVPAGAELEAQAEVAILEFLAWSHNRAPKRLVLEPGQVQVSQVVESGADVTAGDSRAFFRYDAEPATQRDFPGWANPHDLALDELRDLAATMPVGMHQMNIGVEGSTLQDILMHCATTEQLYATHLRPSIETQPLHGQHSALARLGDAHSLLQQVVCDVPPELRARRPSEGDAGMEEWSVRKVMRRSIWHLRYHTWEIRRAVSGIWLGP